MVSIEDFNRLLEDEYKSCKESALKLMQYVRKEYNIEDKKDSREDVLKKSMKKSVGREP